MPLRRDATAPLARANPTAKVGAAAILMAGLFFSSGPLPPILVLGALVGGVPFIGLSPRVLLSRTWPLLLAALSVGLLNVLLAPTDRHGPDLVRGLSLGLRLLGIALSGVLALASTDPTDLADSLQQQARLSPRLAIGVLAAVRMLPILAAEWRILAMARRARGVTSGRSPFAAVRLAFGMLLALLVSSVRRATRLATAMDARGFGAAKRRTIARPQRMRRFDWWLLAGSLGLGLLAVGIGLAL